MDRRRDLRGLIGLALALAACPSTTPPPAVPPPATTPTPTPDTVVATFETAVLAGRDHYLALFNFTKVGVFEKLLHPYDLMGRVPLTGEQRRQFEAEKAVPYPPQRERRNLGFFFPSLAQRTVGTGGCRPVEPASEYARLLGQPFPPLPPEYLPFERMRMEVNEMLERGGLVGLECSGGQGRLALVWTHAPNNRGWELVTMYDDVPVLDSTL